MITVTFNYLSKYKVQVLLDGEPAFVVSPKQILEMDLDHESELGEEAYERMMDQAAHLAAKAAMDLLVKRDYAKEELRSRLVRKGFNSELAARGLAYVEKYHYVDDERYARHLVDVGSESMSRQKMIMKLKQRGLKEDLIDLVVSEADFDEKSKIRKEILKKYKDEAALKSLDDKAKQKLIASLLRKGFSYSDVRTVLKSFN